MKQAEPGKSIFCWGFLPKPVTFSYDGEQHCNDMSFCCYTALKGMIRFQMNKDDFELLTTGTARFLEKLAECGKIK